MPGLTLHHLHMAQSERFVWLLGELGVQYKLVTYDRSPIMAPAELKSLPGNVLGTAPVLQDGDDGTGKPTITLCESGAILEYILTKYGKDSSLIVDPAADNWTQYIYWIHAANGALQPSISGNMSMVLSGITEDSPARQNAMNRLSLVLKHMDASLAATGAYLAGNDLTAADIMVVFSLTTMRNFYRYSLAEYPNIVAYLARIGQLSGYRQAMEKGDPGMELSLGAEPPAKSQFEIVGSWKR